ncbi:hypothetical protein [Sphingobacterium griseoflavum]|uniref:Uncharacterized protein n=1 Tax=Sphingobacterium griseoflavum TaxID=1474952 RepID=A0ABQ3HWP4_9SPHI|nr:hypothetical protein [Sphingobacterium griseoflavum]GHE30523.1 hypothetical protein GCM10017764_11800 [Sphingobacterium griseoflavum]
MLPESGNSKMDKREEATAKPSDDLIYDAEKSSYVYDVANGDPDYEHPADYPTLSEGAEDDDSSYDEANPFVGDEYAEKDELKGENLENSNMHIVGEEDLKVSPYDKKLAEDMEDYRDDLDEEGYPK